MNHLLTEESIRPAELMAKKRACIDHDRSYLLARRSEWVEVGCPACTSAISDDAGEKNGFAYRRCRPCGTVYTSPRPGPVLLDAFYRQSHNYAFWNAHIFPATEEVRCTTIFRPRAERLRDLIGAEVAAGATLVDVGAAFGTFCQAALEAGLAREVVALEPTPDLAATCRRRGLEVIESALEHVERPEIADIVTAFEVIEHVYDPAAFVAGCLRLLRPGGLLVLSCPNVRGFGIAELGLASDSFDHEHLNYFHPQSLRALVQRCGAEPEQVLTPGMLDADLVRSAALRGDIDLSDRPFLEEVLLQRWEELGGAFQAFLRTHGLSSHLWIVARKRTSAPRQEGGRP